MTSKSHGKVFTVLHHFHYNISFQMQTKCEASGKPIKCFNDNCIPGQYQDEVD